jgi:hypothetical protein
MSAIQREQNPDVNSYNPDLDPGESTDTSKPTDGQHGDEDVIPVPPDTRPAAPVEAPPGTDGPPVGDVDDSPKRIA